jgi:ADP-ribose pyrophosphatase
MLERQVLVETPLFVVTQNVALNPAGREIRRVLLEHQGSAVVMPVDAKGRVMLVRQYRLPAEDYLWELPAGKVDAGETPLQAAKRELKEETGLRAKKWTRMLRYWASPGFLREEMHLFLAEELTVGAAAPMEDEDLEARWFTVREMKEMVARNEICDGKTVMGLFLYGEHKRRRGKGIGGIS